LSIWYAVILVLPSKMVGFAPLYHIGRKEGKKYEGRQPGGQAGGLLKLKKQEGGFFERI
jgi:hypothetical protein